MHRLLCFAALAPIAVAGTTRVPPGGELQAALDRAVAGDTLYLEPGVYRGHFRFPRHPIAVIGVQGAARTTLDGGDGWGSVIRIEHAGRDEEATLIQGVTLTNGSGTAVGARHLREVRGGGAYVDSARVHFVDCRVRANRTYREDAEGNGKGGGIYGYQSHLVLRNCRITANEAMARWEDPGTEHQNNGGGVCAWESTLDFLDCEISGNVCGRSEPYVESSSSGGGAAVVAGRLWVRGSRFISNFATGTGGLQASLSPATVEDSAFMGNVATGDEGPMPYSASGGAVFCDFSLRVERCLFEDNAALAVGTGASRSGAITCFDSLLVVDSVFRRNRASRGGALNLSTPYVVRITGSRFIENVAGFLTEEHPDWVNGGAISVWGGDGAIIDNNTFVGNRIRSLEPVESHGSAIHYSWDEGRVANNLFVGNAGSPALYLDGPVRHHHNAFWHNPGGDAGGGWYEPGEGELFEDPRLCLIDEAYLPGPQSPLIDAGMPLPYPPERGWCGDAPDIGAEERCGSLPPCVARPRPRPKKPIQLPDVRNLFGKGPVK